MVVCSSASACRADGQHSPWVAGTAVPKKMNLDVVSCAVCGSDRSRRILTKFGLDIAQCRDCEFVFANPRLSPEEIARRYSPEYFWNEYLPSIGVIDGKYDPAFGAARYGPLLELIADEVAPPARLFEVGAGAGAFLDAARGRGYVVEGIEFSTEAAAFARERLGLQVRQGLAEELQTSETWDVVVAFETVEHLLDPRGVLERVRGLLVDGGVLVLSVPNLGALSRTFLGAEWAVLSPAEHLSYFTEGTLGRFLRELGYVEVRFERRHPGFGLAETMNAACTHRPGSWRQLVYRAFVRLLGHRVLPRVRAAGRGDTLLCVARAPRGPMEGPGAA